MIKACEYCGAQFDAPSRMTKFCSRICFADIREIQRTPDEDRIRRVWLNMKARCYNPKNAGFHRYGDRGIKICDEWNNSLANFTKWAFANNYASQLTIERTNNNGNYEPSNCKWATPTEQARNRRTNSLVEYQGETLPLAVWAERAGIDAKVLYLRIFRRKWSAERALTEPNCSAVLSEDDVNNIRAEYDGRRGSFGKMADQYGVHVSTIKAVISRKNWRHLA